MIFVTGYFIRHLDVPYEISDDCDFVRTSVRKFNTGKLILNQYHQLELIEPIEAEIIAEARFVLNLFDVDTKILGDKRAYSVGIKISLWRDWCAHRFPRFFPTRQKVGPSAHKRLHLEASDGAYS